MTKANQKINDPEAMTASIYFELGNDCLRTAKEPQHFAKAAAAFATASTAGHPIAKFNLALMYENGVGVAPDIGKAIILYTQALNRGVEQAEYNLARLYHLGIGVEVDHTTAMALYSNSNQAAAKNNLGTIYENNGESKKALTFYRRAALENYPEALYNLALKFLKGDGVRCNANRAVSLLIKSFELKFSRAGYLLGSLYMQGESVPVDIEKALYYLQKAAYAGCVQSATLLGNICGYGACVEKQMEKSFYWHRKAAENRGLPPNLFDRDQEQMTTKRKRKFMPLKQPNPWDDAVDWSSLLGKSG